MASNTVLFVDDDPFIIESPKLGLSDETYHKLYASNGYKAIRSLEKIKTDVIVSDSRMSGMTGLKLLRDVKKDFPWIIRIVLTAYNQTSILLDAINQGQVYKYINEIVGVRR